MWRWALLLAAGCGRYGFPSHDSVDARPLDGPAVDAPELAYRKTLTIDRGKVAGAVANVVVPVHIADPDLRPVAMGGRIETGSDVVFVTGDGTRLPFDLDHLSVDGDLLAWVNVGAVSPGADVTFYLDFGGATVTTSQGDSAATWSDAAAVYHLSDLTLDATGAHPGTPMTGVGTTAAGKFGGAATFTGNCPKIVIPASSALQPASITVSAWANPSDIGTSTDRIATIVAQDYWRAAGTGSQGYYLEVYRTVSQPEPTFYAANGPTFAHAFATPFTVTNGTWYYIVGTYDAGTGTSSIYVDGILRGTQTMTGPIAYINEAVQIGCSPGSGYWNGSIDEVRISAGAHSAAQIATEFATQSPGALGVSPTQPK